jgi:hypothetical protein
VAAKCSGPSWPRLIRESWGLRRSCAR